MTTQRQVMVLAAVALCLLAAVPAATAQQDTDAGGPLLFGTAPAEQDASTWTQVTLAGEVAADRVLASLGGAIPAPIQSALGMEVSTAADYARRIRQCAAPTDADLAWLNQHASDYNLSRYDTVAVRVTGDRGGHETLYLTAAHANGSLTDATIATTAPDRQLDWRVTLDRYATAHLCADHAWLRSHYVQPGTAPDRALAARLSARYYGHVEYTEVGA